MDTKSKAQLRELDQKLILLLKDLKNYSDAKLNEKPDEASWSVLQIMQHLMMAEVGSLQYIKKKLSFNPVLEKAGVMAGLRSTLLNLSLKSPFKVKAPKQISGEFLSSNTTFWEVAKNWKQQRKVLEEYLYLLPKEIFNKEAYKHPLTGKMKISDMLSFFNTHVNRHTRQIKRTLKKVDAVKQI